MIIHPLRLTYVDKIKTLYNKGINPRDPKPEQTELIATKVSALGLCYDDFIELALGLWDRYAKRQGWPYPYWNLVIGNKTFERLGKLVKYASNAPSNCEDDAADFEDELAYASDYIDWMHGQLTSKPKRSGKAEVTADMKKRVAKYLCRLYGIPYQTYNYNDIALRTSNNGY